MTAEDRVLAGERSAGAHPYLMPPEHTADARDLLGAGPLLVPEQKVYLGTDAAEARRVARRGVELYLGLPNYTRALERDGHTTDDFADGGSDRLLDRTVAWGDDDAVRARLEEHRDVGGDHVLVQVLTGGRSGTAGLPVAEWRRLAELLELTSG